MMERVADAPPVIALPAVDPHRNGHGVPSMLSIQDMVGEQRARDLRQFLRDHCYCYQNRVGGTLGKHLNHYRDCLLKLVRDHEGDLSSTSWQWQLIGLLPAKYSLQARESRLYLDVLGPEIDDAMTQYVLLQGHTDRLLHGEGDGI